MCLYGLETYVCYINIHSIVMSVTKSGYTQHFTERTFIHHAHFNIITYSILVFVRVDGVLKRSTLFSSENLIFDLQLYLTVIHSMRHRATYFILILYFTDVRISEMFKLEWRQFYCK